jgi:colanic acid biosynthesis glycosyl transferase WcaI
MKILIVCQYFWPESFRVNDVAASLRERGHEVTVLTGKPNYPAGDFFPGYNFLGQYRETYRGVDVLRIPIIPRGQSKALQLLLNYLSFAFFGSLIAPFRARTRYDAILVYALSPIFMVIPALILKMLGRGPVYIWLQDLWPESLSATGAVHSKTLLRFVGIATALIHRNVDLNFVSCAGFCQKLKAMGVDAKRIRYLPNYAEDIYGEQANVAGCADFDALVPKGFRVMFAGNVGEAQDFPMIIAAAELLKSRKHIQWVIVGDGRALPWVKEEVARRGLQDVFHLVGKFPVEQMPQWYACADAMLVTLRSDPIFALTLPTKVHSYMAASKPILAALEGEAALILNESKCGICVAAGDAAALAEAVVKASHMNPEERRQLGLSGRAYFEVHFERKRLIAQLEEWLQPAVSGA